MVKRFNVLMTIQVPLEQSKPKRNDYPVMFVCSAAPAMEGAMYSLNITCPAPLARSAPSHMRRREVKKGMSRAARVSRGDYTGPYERISSTARKRNTAEYVTVTCVRYNTVMDGVPTAADCIGAIEDMERLYAACSETGRLAYATFGFMNSELTVSDMVKIDEKLTKQPPLPPPKPDSVLPPAPLDGHGLVRAKVA